MYFGLLSNEKSSFSSSVVGVKPVFLYTPIRCIFLNGNILDPHPIKMRDFSANSWRRNER